MTSAHDRCPGVLLGILEPDYQLDSERGRDPVQRLQGRADPAGLQPRDRRLGRADPPAKLRLADPAGLPQPADPLPQLQRPPGPLVAGAGGR